MTVLSIIGIGFIIYFAWLESTGQVFNEREHTMEVKQFSNKWTTLVMRGWREFGVNIYGYSLMVRTRTSSRPSRDRSTTA